MLMTPETKALVDSRKERYNGGKVADDNYDKVIAHIPNWRPTYWVQKFGVDAIQRITGCSLTEAVEIRDTLDYQGALPTRKWSDR